MTNNNKEITRPLSLIAQLIKKEWEQGKTDAVDAFKPHWAVIGELLTEAKAQLEHGEFKTWFERQKFSFSYVTASKRMRAAKLLPEFQKSRGATFLESPPSADDVMYPDRVRTPSEQKLFQEKIDRMVTGAQRFAAEAKKRREEEELVRGVALKIIDVGFKILSIKWHPDKPGGSTQAMRRLNAAKTMLKERI